MTLPPLPPFPTLPLPPHARNAVRLTEPCNLADRRRRRRAPKLGARSCVRATEYLSRAAGSCCQGQRAEWFTSRRWRRGRGGSQDDESVCGFICFTLSLLSPLSPFLTLSLPAWSGGRVRRWNFCFQYVFSTLCFSAYKMELLFIVAVVVVDDQNLPPILHNSPATSATAASTGATR